MLCHKQVWSHPVLPRSRWLTFVTPYTFLLHQKLVGWDIWKHTTEKSNTTNETSSTSVSIASPGEYMANICHPIHLPSSKYPRSDQIFKIKVKMFNILIFIISRWLTFVTPYQTSPLQYIQVPLKCLKFKTIQISATSASSVIMNPPRDRWLTFVTPYTSLLQRIQGPPK